MKQKTTIVALGAAVVVLATLKFISSNKISNDEEIVLRSLSAQASKGKSVYDANCATCHGQNASGTDKGPPFIHKIYEPNHHGDASFQQAARNGVRAHHWPYGNMPPVPTVTEADVAMIIDYVRELQRASGIR